MARVDPRRRAALEEAFADLFGTAFARSKSDLVATVRNAASAAFVEGRVRMAELDPEDDPAQSIVDSFLPATVLDPYSEAAFNLSGEISDDLRREGERFLQDALARGISQDEMQEQLRGAFSRWIETGRVELVPEGNVVPLTATGRVETIVRTEYGKAYNTGRNALMMDPDVDVVRGLEYSSILDARTTDYCRAWDGVVFDKRDVDRIARNGPPAHFNCRSMLVPITIYDDEPVTPEWRYPRGDVAEPLQGFGATVPKGAR